MIIRLFLLILLAGLGACEFQAPEKIVVDEAWVRSMPPGTKMTAAYFNITNNGTEEIRIIGAGAAEFSSATFHKSVVTDGVASMVEIKEMVIDPGETVSLIPGGKHMMLTGGKFDEIPVNCCALRLEVEDELPVLFYARLNR
jgi:copper(I)-binding protein